MPKTCNAVMASGKECESKAKDGKTFCGRHSDFEDRTCAHCSCAARTKAKDGRLVCMRCVNKEKRENTNVVTKDSKTETVKDSKNETITVSVKDFKALVQRVERLELKDSPSIAKSSIVKAFTSLVKPTKTSCEGCQGVLKSGDRKGQLCGKTPKPGSQFCGTHSK